MQLTNGIKNSLRLTHKISVIASWRLNSKLSRNAKAFFWEVSEVLKNFLNEEYSWELLTWFQSGTIELKVSGSPRKIHNLKNSPWKFNTSETERYKNGLVIDIMAESGNLYIPCNLSIPNISVGAQDLLRRILISMFESVPPVQSLVPASSVQWRVDNVLAFPNPQAIPESTWADVWEITDAWAWVDRDPALDNLSWQAPEAISRIPEASTENIPYSPNLSIHPDAINESEPLPQKVFLRVVRAIRENPSLEDINKEKWLYFISDVALRAIVAEGALWWLGNDFLTEKRILEALPRNFSGVSWFFRPHFRVNISQFDAKRDNAEYDQTMLELLDTLMVGNNQKTLIEGDVVRLVPYIPQELEALRQLLNSANSESNLRKFYGSINSWDARTRRTIIKGFFVRIPENLDYSQSEEELSVKSDDTLKSELADLVSQRDDLQGRIWEQQTSIEAIDAQLSELRARKSNFAAQRFEDFYSDNPGEIFNSLRKTLSSPVTVNFNQIPDLIADIKSQLSGVLSRHDSYNQKKTEFASTRKDADELSVQLTTLEDQRTQLEQELDTMLNQMEQVRSKIKSLKEIISSRIKALEALLAG